MSLVGSSASVAVTSSGTITLLEFLPRNLNNGLEIKELALTVLNFQIRIL